MLKRILKIDMSYPKKECAICGRLIPTVGMAQSSHMRKHIRHGDNVKELIVEKKVKRFKYTSE